MSSRPAESPSPQVLLEFAGSSFEFVRWLDRARHGERVLARRRYHERFGGYAVLKRPVPLEDEVARRRLRDEACLTSHLRHPNLLAASPLESVEAIPYLMLEHVPGLRLEEVLARVKRIGHPLSEAFACHVVAEVAEALHHAHTQVDERGRPLGLVHRDVTPYNVLLSEWGEVKLLDFGAAWSRLPGRVDSEGTFQGSLAYASPEHVQRRTLDGRADQFSLGIILLQLLAGRHLFEGAERFDAHQRQPPAAQEAATHLCAQELEERIRCLRLEEVEAATRAIPQALRPLLHQALAPERAERFDTCAHLAHLLREHLYGVEPHFGRRLLLAELATLRYVSLRLEVGAALDDAVRDRLLPEPRPLCAPRFLLGRRSPRLHSLPRRR